MIGGQKILKWLIPVVAILHRAASPNAASAACDFSFLDGNRIYNYTLTSPMRDFPHGVCSEDGVLCLFGVYLLAGIVYRHFFLGIRGIDSPSLPSQELREMRASNLSWGFTVIWTEIYVHLRYFRLSPIWTSGQPCSEEPRVFVLLWRGSSRDLLKVTAAHILL